MSRFAPMLLTLTPLVLSCDGDDGQQAVPPEICDDGIDNDDDGLVDCDDEACGGLVCRDPGDDDDDDTGTAALPVVEVQFDPLSCCDFNFSVPDDCSKNIGSFHVINRSQVEDALIKTISCDVSGGGTPLVLFQLDGGQPRPFQTDVELEANTQVEVTAVFDCGAQQSFDTECRAKVELGEVVDEYEWTTRGTEL